MKCLISFPLLLFCLFSFSCATTETSGRMGGDARPDDAITDDFDHINSLADYLRRVPGVQIEGRAPNHSIIIRGVSSLTGDNQPLFVIDGQPAGRDYAQINSMINVREIDYVRVLRGNQAAFYGVLGGNGVIQIFMR
ncbi:MAG: TonB-dependent receptor plug domain-containing protein [Balneolaceae bacterium]|nr:TonB-dependent receptor plug domain-containing protein [Balneolaceae bacterium]